MKRDRLLKFAYLKGGIFHEWESTFFLDNLYCYRPLINCVETKLRAEGVKFEKATNYNDTILNSFNRLSPKIKCYIDGVIGLELLEIIEFKK